MLCDVVQYCIQYCILRESEGGRYILNLKGGSGYAKKIQSQELHERNAHKEFAYCITRKKVSLRIKQINASNFQLTKYEEEYESSKVSMLYTYTSKA
jgi:hypothetical protein